MLRFQEISCYAKKGLQVTVNETGLLLADLNEIIANYAFEDRERFDIVEFRFDNRGCRRCGVGCACLWETLHSEYRHKMWNVEELHNRLLEISKDPPSSMRIQDRHLESRGVKNKHSFWHNLNIPKSWDAFHRVEDYLAHVNNLDEEDVEDALFAEVQISRHPPWQEGHYDC